MLKSKKNKGITLIALIVTIVVMLILVGVTVRVVIGDNSIVNQSAKAKEKTRAEEIKEQISLAIAENQFAEYTNGNKISKMQLISQLRQNGKLKEDEAELLEIQDSIIIGGITIDFSDLNVDGSKPIYVASLNDWEYTKDDENKTITLNNYIGSNHNIYVPAIYMVDDVEYNTILYSDVSSQKGTFSGNSIIYSVTFEEGVNAIGMSYMFKACENLRYVENFPSYNGVWWTGVFISCSNLLYAPPIPNNIENIRISNFFNGCTRLLGNYEMPDNYNSNYINNVFNNATNINKGTNILWFGDSISAGTTTNGTSYVTYLREDLEDVGIANYAIGGHTLSYGYDNTESDIEWSVINDMNKLEICNSIDYVFVAAGTNDFAHNSSRSPLGTYRFADIGSSSDTVPNTIYGSIYTIDKIVKQKFPNAKLIFITPITRNRYDIEGAKASDNSIFTVHLKDYVDAIKDACNSKGIDYIDAYLESGLEVTEDACDGTENYMSDLTHPTLAGQKVMEEYVLNKLVTNYNFSLKN